MNITEFFDNAGVVIEKVTIEQNVDVKPIDTLKTLVADMESGEVTDVAMNIIALRNSGQTVSMISTGRYSGKDYGAELLATFSEPNDAATTLTALREDGMFSHQQVDGGHLLLVGEVDNEHCVAALVEETNE